MRYTPSGAQEKSRRPKSPTFHKPKHGAPSRLAAPSNLGHPPKSIVDLITAIIKARPEGIKKGDHPSEPLELIVRRVHDAQEFREETVLRIGHKDTVDEAKVEQQLKDALRKLLKDKPPTRTPRK